MSDIFISYKKEDAGRVVRIVEGLRAEGFSVWWDHGIAPGAQWDQTIQQQLNVAKVVIAVWSQESVAAPWVKEEAGVGKNRGILLPVRIDDVEPPLGFGLIQAADLRGWDGDPKDPHFRHFLSAVGAVLKGEQPVGLETPRRKGGLPGWALGLIGAVVIAGAAAAGWMMLRGGGVEVAGRGGDGQYEATARVGYETPQAPASTQPGAPPASSPPRPATPTGAADPRDEATFAAAREARTREAYQNYLIAYPNGAYAERARDILLTCRAQTVQNWEAGLGSAQPVRGVSVETDLTQQQACAEAERMARRQAETNCAAIAGNVGYRNPRPSVQSAQCDCSQREFGWACTIDMPARCDWEQLMTRQTEVCG